MEEVLGSVPAMVTEGDDVTTFVNNIIFGRIPLDNMNLTNVALIPKVKNPTCISQFRPFSLCNVLYKLASKSVANRLKPLLHDMVTENQSAFVPKRQITDNALIALELFHTMKKRSKGLRGTIAMKLDMSKAYDRVEWEFLRLLLTKLGFARAWAASEKKLIHGARASRYGPEITHLLFADDSLLFTRATRQECSIIVDILNKYEATSGQKINLEKSEVSFSKGVQLSSRITFSYILSMEMVGNHIKYLGLPTVVGRSKKEVFAFVKDRIWKKVQAGKRSCYLEPRLVTNEQSLVSRVFEAKYHPQTSIFEAALGPVSSFSWQSLWSLKALVMEGMLKRVGDGRNINIWTDPWLIDDESRFVTTESINDLYTTVDELIDTDNSSWDMDKIESIFNDRDKLAILAIPINERKPNDTLTLAWSKNGCYSVKTAYILGKSLALDNFEHYWVEVWKAKITPEGSTLPMEVLLKHSAYSKPPCA
ncbi:uncharacterized protein LOC110684695 [Chenopodium quinoa]|uniref:uncharacterized protein LOC110684695 n=1 Tax=Chenopodium quinoa TaxID=63459 RepID=UPI000B7825EB|nr:uncharacterized protein LOC110684695 [Chenopodium quinoa]